MKGLTLTQPWATLVAIGAKRVETRSWSTNYRGPIAIHAAKGFPPEARALCDEEPFRSCLVRSPVRSRADVSGTTYRTCSTCRGDGLPHMAVVAEAQP